MDSGLRRYLSRSCLSAAGIAVSVASMVILANLVATVHRAAAAGLAALGGQVLLVGPSAQTRLAPGSARGLSLGDIDAVRRQVRDLDLVVPLYAVQGLARTDRARRVVSIYGVVPGLERLQNLIVEEGRFIVDAEVAAAMPAVVLGRDVAEALGGLSPGDVVHVSGRPFHVRGITVGGQRLLGATREDAVYVPASTAEAIYRGAAGSLGFMVQVGPRLDVADAADAIRTVLRTRRRLSPDDADDFTIDSQRQLLEGLDLAASGAQTILVSLVGITLIIAVIGVLNSVLTSVLERTAEIGLRRAVGATRMAIQRAFVTEALLVAAAGAVTGTVVGLSAGALLAMLLHLEFVIDWPVTALANGAALTFSAMASLWPALRAARLDPVRAIHHE
jgi:putative ABC transport system permease protein